MCQMCACVRACVRACMHACLHACMKNKWETAVLDEDVRHVEPITRRVSKPEVPPQQASGGGGAGSLGSIQGAMPADVTGVGVCTLPQKFAYLRLRVRGGRGGCEGPRRGEREGREKEGEGEGGRAIRDAPDQDGRAWRHDAGGSPLTHHRGGRALRHWPRVAAAPPPLHPRLPACPGLPQAPPRPLQALPAQRTGVGLRDPPSRPRRARRHRAPKNLQGPHTPPARSGSPPPNDAPHVQLHEAPSCPQCLLSRNLRRHQHQAFAPPAAHTRWSRVGAQILQGKSC